MQRRTFLMALTAAPLFASKPADPSQEVFDLFAKIASELSADNPMLFLESVDHDMPHYQNFENNIMALTGQADLTASIEIVTDRGDDNRRDQELDWFMQIVSKGNSTDVERRREVIKVRVERHPQKWKIVSMEPVSFFGPPKWK